jgi:hypothetical protein
MTSNAYRNQQTDQVQGYVGDLANPRLLSEPFQMQWRGEDA